MIILNGSTTNLMERYFGLDLFPQKKVNLCLSLLQRFLPSFLVCNIITNWSFQTDRCTLITHSSNSLLDSSKLL